MACARASFASRAICSDPDFLISLKTTAEGLVGNCGGCRLQSLWIVAHFFLDFGKLQVALAFTNSVRLRRRPRSGPPLSRPLAPEDSETDQTRGEQ
jgi:hypothetical protein